MCISIGGFGGGSAAGKCSGYVHVGTGGVPVGFASLRGSRHGEGKKKNTTNIGGWKRVCKKIEMKKGGIGGPRTNAFGFLTYFQSQPVGEGKEMKAGGGGSGS